MKNIPLDKLEQFRHEWQSEVAETLDDFLRSKATCISDRMEQELVEISQLKAKIQRVYDNILTSESNPDLVYDMVRKVSFRLKIEKTPSGSSTATFISVFCGSIVDICISKSTRFQSRKFLGF